MENLTFNLKTIAGQIERINSAKTTLASVGHALLLNVPEGDYWNGSEKVSYEGGLLTLTDSIDKIAAAFNTFNADNIHINGSETVELKVEYGTQSMQGDSLTLNGYYNNYTITPVFTLMLGGEALDQVLNVESAETGGQARELTSIEGKITPNPGFDVMKSVNYEILQGSIGLGSMPTNPLFVGTSPAAIREILPLNVVLTGWISTATTTLPVSVLSTRNYNMPTWRYQSYSLILDNINTWNPDNYIEAGLQSNKENFGLTISAGIIPLSFTISIPTLKTLTTIDEDEAAGDEHILDGYKAYVNGELIEGTMPDNSGKTVITSTIIANSGLDLIVGVPSSGYYTNDSKIKTSIVCRSERILSANIDNMGDENPDNYTEVTLNGPVYYEHIPAGYYVEDLKYKLNVHPAELDEDITIDYSANTASFNITSSGWVNQQEISAAISVGIGTIEPDSLEQYNREDHRLVSEIATDMYFNQVLVDNTKLYEKLAAI